MMHDNVLSIAITNSLYKTDPEQTSRSASTPSATSRT